MNKNGKHFASYGFPQLLHRIPQRFPDFFSTLRGIPDYSMLWPPVIQLRKQSVYSLWTSFPTSKTASTNYFHNQSNGSGYHNQFLLLQNINRLGNPLTLTVAIWVQL